LEGISDIFRIPSGDFYQILIRDRAERWSDGENRRGYPFGLSYPEYFMYLWPGTEVSYQILTEYKLFEAIPEKVREAQKIGARIYDIELGYYNEKYMDNLKRMLENLGNHAAR